MLRAADPPPIDGWQEFFDAVHDAYRLAKGERGNVLHGRYVKRFGDDGLHPYSVVWGRIGYLTTEEIASWLRENEIRLAPIALKVEAEADADQDFRDELRSAEK